MDRHHNRSLHRGTNIDLSHMNSEGARTSRRSLKKKGTTASNKKGAKAAKSKKKSPYTGAPLVSGKTLILYKDDADISLTAYDLNFYLLDLGVVQGHKDDATTALVGASMSVEVESFLDTESDNECFFNEAGGSVGVGLELRAFPNCYTAEECGADGTAEEGTDFRVLAPGLIPLTVIWKNLRSAPSNSAVGEFRLTYSTNHASFVLVDEEPGDFFLQAVLWLDVYTGTFSEDCGAGRSLLDAEVLVTVTDWVITINEDVIVIESPDPGDPLTLSPTASP